MTVRQLCNESKLSYQDAEYLLAHVLGLPRETLLTHPEQKVGVLRTMLFKWLTKRRRRHTPLTYLTHKCYFYNHQFLVNRHVLIPRHTTEILVEKALAIIKKEGSIRTVVDIGTGSGAIIISVALGLSRDEQQRVSFHASDLHRTALRVAKKNALRLGISNIHWHYGDLLRPLLPTLQKASGTTLLTANLPYLGDSDFTSTKPEVQNFEPATSLRSGSLGLDHNQRLINELSLLPSPRPKLLFEMDPCHQDELVKYITTRLPNAAIEVIDDEAKHPRFIFVC
ncbi:hypothetical protein COV04_03475 [Candidatus Uhrbacteria bacterium CG10_big_fil_rev_8_21_14_0_10_48_11]|uniref:Release factor glutamine methyltransferase N-terminal domain-containing protein n=1 Tax=Candidatus Uhrbacteria bacterium CG10_big_fil_rev_8_21_14_0_10_48_11 TaxID=1975037 RepID=A0A2M8LDV9_9BACT|nr:MAG: hypothetical protein COV04_03475 [Candidatus Uhrbacteria bacterium CG10_big_fil_rev_8_21_14_0_10_48_11]